MVGAQRFVEGERGPIHPERTEHLVAHDVIVGLSEFAVGLEIVFGIDRRRRCLARIDKDVLAVARAVQQEHSAAADARTLRFDHRQRRRDRDRCVEGVAAVREDFVPGVGCQRMRAGNRGMSRPAGRNLRGRLPFDRRRLLRSRRARGERKQRCGKSIEKRIVQSASHVSHPRMQPRAPSARRICRATAGVTRHALDRR